MTAIIRRNGYRWPASDKHAHRVIFDTVSDMAPALLLTEGRSMAFQAGGNCGVWANWLAELFSKVVTVEPVPILFECLMHNIKPNVHPVRCGLAHKAGPALIDMDDENTGAAQMSLIGTSGNVQLRTIDSLLGGHIEKLDYLCLDIEGMELLALQGAKRRIETDRPVIQIEDKGLSRRYGVEKGHAERWLADRFGYVVHSRVHRDVILKPEEL